MTFFDSLPKKIVDRCPSQFADTVSFAAELIESDDLPRIRAALDREAYSAAVIGTLALVSHEVTEAWSPSDLAFVADKTRLAFARLPDHLRDLAQVRIRSVTSHWNLNWHER